MQLENLHPRLTDMASRYPEKFAAENVIFSHIHPGNRIFIGTIHDSHPFDYQELGGVRIIF